jgi:glucose/arabinose dehydrogenase
LSALFGGAAAWPLIARAQQCRAVQRSGRESQTMRDVTQSKRVVGKGFLALAGVKKSCSSVAAALLDSLAVVIGCAMMHGMEAQAAAPTMLDPNLAVRTVVAGLNQPTTMAFLGPTDILVLEKATGRVQRVVNGAIQSTVLDLAVNSASERGLLGIALHPNFPSNHLVYLFWTESSTGADSNVLAEVPMLGNRVDRFIWTGSVLTLDRNLIKLRALQADAGQTQRGNHDGGVMKFGPDGKLYIFMGDNGRRGYLQNLPCGPTATCPGPTVVDDQFGGPAPDNAHFTGVILRLNDDGSTPTDNPFFAAGAATGGEVGANIQKIFAYGLRNSFGMDFDPKSGSLWLEQNGDDSFSELGLIDPGTNGGWVQIMGPVSRIAEYKAIETSPATDPCVGTAYFGLQQDRWAPTLIADTPANALSRLFMLPGAIYKDPQFSWKFEVAPAGIGFVKGGALGPQYDGDLFMGAAGTSLQGGHLFHFKLTDDRRQVAADDPRLADRVADNACKFDIAESESLLIGVNFGIGTDIQTGPNGNLFVISLSNGAIYEIFRRRSHDFNGGGISDILLQTTSNGVGMWLMNSSAAVGSALNVGTLPSGWSIVGQRDLNRDGFADMLLRHTDGSVGEWLLNGATITAANGLGNPTTAWNIVGTGDFNGDGIGDILWRGGGTAVTIWYMNISGGLALAVGMGSLPVQWSVAGTGDFDGDGIWDILWTHSSGANALWLMTSSGTIKSAVGLGSLPPATWSVAGTGDFNGDGISDILWLGGGASLAIWFMNSSGGIASAQGVGTLPFGWAVAQTGDYNGSGRSDILLYHAASGTVAAWLMNGATIASAVTIGTLPPATWSIVSANSD